MIEHEHVTYTYETWDGKIFDDEDEAIDYEMNSLYQGSGIRFINIDGKVIEKLNIECDMTYNEAEYVTIDRSKYVENRKFCDTASRLCGWELLQDMMQESETAEKYKMYFNRMAPIK